MSRRKIGGDDLGGGCRVSITEFVTCEKCGMEEFIEIAKGQRWNLNEDICDTCIKNYVDKKEGEYDKESGCQHYSGKCGSPTNCNDEDCPKKEKKIRFCESQCCSMGFVTYSKESWKCDYLGYYDELDEYKCDKYNEVLTPFSFDGKKETMIVFRCIDCHHENPPSVQEQAVDKIDIKMLQLPPEKIKEGKKILKRMRDRDMKRCGHKTVIRGSVDDGPGSAHGGWICSECGLEFVALEGNVKKLLDKESAKIVKKITKAMKK